MSVGPQRVIKIIGLKYLRSKNTKIFLFFASVVALLSYTTFLYIKKVNVKGAQRVWISQARNYKPLPLIPLPGGAIVSW